MALSSAPPKAFVWGDNGAMLTPDEIERQRSLELAAAVRGVDTSPVQSWTQGAARVADAIAGAVRRGRLDAAAEDAQKQGAVDFAAAMQSLGGTSGTASQTGATAPYTASSAPGSAPGSADIGNLSGNDVYSGFIDTVKAGGLTNPYGLAAVAATGKAESGFSPGNVNRTWSDPSESGQPGTAGGIMSWRGPRYQALAATGDLSPAGQAKFFLSENPSLIQGLNSAKSVEEAQSLINRAWAFKGYNRPGGEAARRLSLAQGFLPTFQGGGAPAASQVASLDPRVGMPEAAAAIERTAPGSGFVDPYVSAPNGTPTAAAAIPTARPVAPNVPAVQMAGGGGRTADPVLNEAILKAMTSPYMNAGQREVVKALIQQRQSQFDAAREEENWMRRQQFEQQLQANDPARQLQMEYQRAQIDALKAKPQTQWQRLDDDTLYNPATGDIQEVGATATDGPRPFRFEGKSTEAQALNGLMDSGTLTPAQAQELAAGKTITGPNGEIIFMTPSGVFGQQDAQSAPTPIAVPQAAAGGPNVLTREAMPQPLIPGSGNPAPQISAGGQAGARSNAPRANGMITLTEPKVTIDEKKAMTFADRMTASGAIIDQHGTAGEGLMDSGLSQIPVLGNYLVSEEYQKLDQARRDFINAQLRRESGAVISPEEFDNARRQYFPQPGDSPDTVEQKRRNRQTVTKGMARDGGPTYAPPAPAAAEPLRAARDAIARGAPREKVIERLRASGINPEGL